jgi:hypothetical protein
MIPSPHGFARAEDSVGYKKNITFWIESCGPLWVSLRLDCCVLA